MSKELSLLTELTPPPIADFLTTALAHGFTPILVGGAVRDLLLGISEIKDWDFELQHLEGSESRWQALLSSMRSKYRLTPQSHHVIKAQHPDTHFEWQFAPPRTEHYAHRDVFGHGDFEAKVAWNLPFETAVLRRDFTINAMGALFTGSEWKLLDPLNGAKDLAEKTLRSCEREHFRKDPVRFLRAHRFALKFNLQFAPELAEILEHMDLALLTAHYMGEESRKSEHPFLFWNALQMQPTLPAKFQGGVLQPEELEVIYHQNLAGFQHSNAMLAAVFSQGEGWHLLLPLAGKGENETTVWRYRRDHILALDGISNEDFIDTDENLMQKESFKTLCQLTRPPQTWMQWSWVQAVLEQHGLLWISQKPWNDGFDVRSFPPQERAFRKVGAWLRS